MKKAGKFILILTIILTLGSYVTPTLFNGNTNTVEAATKRKTVKEGMVTYTIYPINRYFTPTEVKKIVTAYNKDSNSSISKIIKTAIGTIAPVGLTLLAQDISNTAMMKPFISAQAKNKGVRMKYEYWSGNTSQSVYKIKNKSITIE